MNRYIETCLVLVATSLACDPMRVLTSRTKKNHAEHHARRLLWFHLHSQGIKYETIGKAFRLSDGSIRFGIRYAFFNLAGKHRMILKALPKLECTKLEK